MKENLIRTLLFVLFGHVLTGQSEDYKTILKAARIGYSFYLDKIPNGKEAEYGFSNRSEFSQVKVGKPYQVFALDHSFYSDAKLMDRDYLVSTGEWRVALLVDKKYKTFLTVAKMNGAWEVVGIGAAALARELGSFEKKHPNRNSWGALLRVYPLNCDFVLEITNRPFKIKKVYSIESSKSVFNTDPANKSSHTLASTLSIIKTKLAMESQTK